jgi:hypothetical protein
MNIEKYEQLISRYERSDFITSLSNTLRNEVGFRFLKKSGKGYISLSDDEVRAKIGHALRDSIHSLKSFSLKRSPKVRSSLPNIVSLEASPNSASVLPPRPRRVPSSSDAGMEKTTIPEDGSKISPDLSTHDSAKGIEEHFPYFPIEAFDTCTSLLESYTLSDLSSSGGKFISMSQCYDTLNLLNETPTTESTTMSISSEIFFDTLDTNDM